MKSKAGSGDFGTLTPKSVKAGGLGVGEHKKRESLWGDRIESMKGGPMEMVGFVVVVHIYCYSLVCIIYDILCGNIVYC